MKKKKKRILYVVVFIFAIPKFNLLISRFHNSLIIHAPVTSSVSIRFWTALFDNVYDICCHNFFTVNILTVSEMSEITRSKIVLLNRGSMTFNVKTKLFTIKMKEAIQNKLELRNYLINNIFNSERVIEMIIKYGKVDSMLVS